MLRWVALVVILLLVAIIAISVVLSSRDETPDDVETAVSASPEPAPAGTIDEVELPDIKGIPRQGTAVLVVAERDACWEGYVGGTEIEQCGLQSIGISGDPNEVKAGVRLKKGQNSSLLEIYVVHDGVGLASATAGVPRELIEVAVPINE